MDCSFCIRHSQTLVASNKEAVINTLKEVLDKEEQFDGIGLTGGEPLLDEPFVKQLISTIQEKQPNCPIAVATNGSLLNDDWVNYFNTNNIKLGLSFHSLTGKKSFFEAMALTNNPRLIGHVMTLRNFVFKRVVSPFEPFADELAELKEIFDNTYFEISLDIKQPYNASALLHFYKELNLLHQKSPSFHTQCTFNYTVKSCGFDQVSILNDGSLLSNQCTKRTDLNWSGCSVLFDNLSKDQFDYFIQMTDNFKKGLF
jgi:hypothetical protein